MNLVILGPQGSGKGTQAEMLVNKYGFLRVETGEILREIAKSNSPIAEEIRKTQAEGKLVSDEILERVLTEKLSTSSSKGFLFDGTPRNLKQYELVKYLLSLLGQKLDKVIYIWIPEEEVIRRLSARRMCTKCGNIYNLITKPSPNGEACECGGNLVQREDDLPEAIKKRLTWGFTTEVKQRAKEEGVLVEINGEQSIEDIHLEIVKKLGLV
jgi:adenylate kinase